MWFDCVVGETGEPGRHFRANLAQQHLPPSFAGDRLGTAGRGRWQRETEREDGLILVLTQALFEGAVVCTMHVCVLFFFFLSEPPSPTFTLEVLCSKSSCPKNVQTRCAMNDASPYIKPSVSAYRKRHTVVGKPKTESRR